MDPYPPSNPERSEIIARGNPPSIKRMTIIFVSIIVLVSIGWITLLAVEFDQARERRDAETELRQIATD